MADNIRSQFLSDPATKALIEAGKKYATAKAGSLASGAVQRITPDTATKGAVKGAVEANEKGKSSRIGAMWGGIKGAITGLFKGKGGKRPTNIYETLLIGVPVSTAYEQWTNYSEFPKFMKGPESVDMPDEDGKQKWTAKIFINRRSWTATIEEDVENKRIKWTSEAPKGTIDGVVTFHEIADEATLMVYVLEYRPKGLFEWTGNRWRTVGRRARLDVKHFGRHVMMAEQDGEESRDEAEEAEGAGPSEEAGVAGPGERVAGQAGRRDPAEDEEGGEEDEAESEGGEEGVKPPKAPRHAPRTPRRPRTADE